MGFRQSPKLNQCRCFHVLARSNGKEKQEKAGRKADLEQQGQKSIHSFLQSGTG